MGFFVNWSENGFLGVMLASFLGVVTIFSGTLLNAAQSYGAYGIVIVGLAYLILPTTVLFLPLTGLLRWPAGYFQQIADKP